MDSSTNEVVVEGSVAVGVCVCACVCTCQVRCGAADDAAADAAEDDGVRVFRATRATSGEPSAAAPGLFIPAEGVVGVVGSVEGVALPLDGEDTAKAAAAAEAEGAVVGATGSVG